MSEFIKRKVDVVEPDATSVHKHGQASRPEAALQADNIFLIGPRGSGKSTVARALAERLGMGVQDTDDLAQEAAGMSIADLVAAKGWAEFRELEHQVLAGVCSRKGQVVATGGGIVLREDNRKLLREHGCVFYLLADAVVLQERIKSQQGQSWRPPLSGKPLAQEVTETLAEREPFYFQSLHFILPAHRPVNEIVADVLERLG